MHNNTARPSCKMMKWVRREWAGPDRLGPLRLSPPTFHSRERERRRIGHWEESEGERRRRQRHHPWPRWSGACGKASRRRASPTSSATPATRDTCKTPPSLSRPLSDLRFDSSMLFLLWLFGQNPILLSSRASSISNASRISLLIIGIASFVRIQINEPKWVGNGTCSPTAPNYSAGIVRPETKNTNVPSSCSMEFDKIIRYINASADVIISPNSKSQHSMPSRK